VAVAVPVFVAVLVAVFVAVSVGVEVGVLVGVGVGELNTTEAELHSVLSVNSDESISNAAAAAPAETNPSCVAMKTMVSHVAGLLQSPSNENPSGELCVGGTLLPGARLPIVLPSVSSSVTVWLATSPAVTLDCVLTLGVDGKSIVSPLTLQPVMERDSDVSSKAAG